MKLERQYVIGNRLNQKIPLPSNQLTYELNNLLTINLHKRLYHQLVDILDDEIFRGVLDASKKIN